MPTWVIDQSMELIGISNRIQYKPRVVPSLWEYKSCSLRAILYRSHGSTAQKRQIPFWAVLGFDGFDR
jgi:hypothetical protein